MLHGQMMDRPLLITSILRHAAQTHAASGISSRFATEANHQYTYADAWRRAQQLANVLAKLGVMQGDRVATIAWNDHRHFELYYAIPGIGAVCHTVNPRLGADQLVYILNHAEDRWLFVDPMFMPLIEGIWPLLTGTRGVVVMTRPELMPNTKLANVFCYETLLAEVDADFEWPELDERTAAGLCYTSGTTGNPKGVLYSHRSTVLHAYGTLTVPGVSMRTSDAALVVVPMFHANAWGCPHAAPIVGARLVFPGPKLDGASLYQIMEEERVTLSSGVPTLWLGLLNHLRAHGLHLSTVKTLTSGGSALPRTLLEEFESRGVQVFQGWGMTETSPVATLASLSPELAAAPMERQMEAKLTAGRPVFGIEIAIVDEQGHHLPPDGVSEGEVVVRGPWVAAGYFRNPDATAAAVTSDGWFRTGDVGRIDAQDYLTIVDRAKDLIKSGGEWISSATLERIVLSDPSVAEAAAIGVPHPKWQERPLLLVVARPGSTIVPRDLLDLLARQVPSWWLPDDVLVVQRLPYTATGKVKKTELRREYSTYQLPTAQLRNQM